MAIEYNPIPISRAYPAQYFSGADVAIFLNDQWVSDVVNLQFSLEEQLQPIYGHADYIANRIIRGTRLVRGTFHINLRGALYLHEYLYNYGKSFPEPSSYINDLGNDLTSIANESTNIYDLNTSASSAFDGPVDVDFQDFLDRQRGRYWSVSQGSTTNLQQFARQTPYFQDIQEDDPKSIQFPPLHIFITYGYREDTSNLHNDINNRFADVRSIDYIYPMSVQQVTDITGQPIMEQFTFLAKDINLRARIPDERKRQNNISFPEP